MAFAANCFSFGLRGERLWSRRFKFCLDRRDLGLKLLAFLLFGRVKISNTVIRL